MLKQSFYSVPTRFQRQSKIMQRRSFIIGAATLTALTVAGPVRSSEGKTKMNNLEKWDKTFPQDDRVEHKKVSFYTRFGTRLIGNLYCPKGVSGDLPAIAGLRPVRSSQGTGFGTLCADIGRKRLRDFSF